MALAVAQKMVAEMGLVMSIRFDSAGTHVRRGSERPDPRVSSVLVSRNYQLGPTRSRQIGALDFERFDLIAAMDEANLAALQSQCPPQYRGKLRLLLEFAPELALQEVPDPYYGNLAGFERVLDLCEAGVRGLIKAQVQTL